SPTVSISFLAPQGGSWFLSVCELKFHYKILIPFTNFALDSLRNDKKKVISSRLKWRDCIYIFL
ncbi:MAG: hypothetical protein CMH73_06640, partial [Nitrospina sp.]|nr:hypothetical protein [Nitrospina sp.]